MTSTPRRPRKRPRKWAYALHPACLGSAIDDRLGAPQARKISAAQRRWQHMNAFGSQMPESAGLAALPFRHRVQRAPYRRSASCDQGR